MTELPERIDRARQYSASVDLPDFWRYTEAAIERFRNGLPLPTTISVSYAAQSRQAATVRAILRGASLR